MLRGTLELRTGDYAAAGASYDRALKLRADIFGTYHPLWAEAEIGRATANFALADPEAAMVSALEAERMVVTICGLRIAIYPNARQWCTGPPDPRTRSGAFDCGGRRFARARAGSRCHHPIARRHPRRACGACAVGVHQCGSAAGVAQSLADRCTATVRDVDAAQPPGRRSGADEAP